MSKPPLPPPPPGPPPPPYEYVGDIDNYDDDKIKGEARAILDSMSPEQVEWYLQDRRFRQQRQEIAELECKLAMAMLNSGDHWKDMARAAEWHITFLCNYIENKELPDGKTIQDVVSEARNHAMMWDFEP